MDFDDVPVCAQMLDQLLVVEIASGESVQAAVNDQSNPHNNAASIQILSAAILLAVVNPEVPGNSCGDTLEIPEAPKSSSPILAINLVRGPGNLIFPDLYPDPQDIVGLELLGKLVT